VTNPRERTKKSSGAGEEQTENPSAEIQAEEVKVGGVPAEAAERAKSPLDEVMSQAEKAYAAYMEADSHETDSVNGLCRVAELNLRLNRPDQALQAIEERNRNQTARIEEITAEIAGIERQINDHAGVQEIWRIVSPESSLSQLEGCDGYIAQVWTGTSREPVYYDGVEKERVFENAFLEYGSMVSMTAPTNRKLFFLTDPIEDRARDWARARSRQSSRLAGASINQMVWVENCTQADKPVTAVCQDHGRNRTFKHLEDYPWLMTVQTRSLWSRALPFPPPLNAGSTKPFPRPSPKHSESVGFSTSPPPGPASI